MARYKFRHHQQGATLVVSLIMLLIITAIAASTLTSSTFQTKMSANAQQRTAVFRAAESATEQVLPISPTTASAAKAAGTGGTTMATTNPQTDLIDSAKFSTVVIDMDLNPSNKQSHDFMGSGTGIKNGLVSYQVHPFEVRGNAVSQDGRIYSQVVVGVGRVERGDLNGPSWF